MALTFNPSRAMVMNYIHTKTQKFKDQSVQKIEWKQTNRQTDGETDVSDCFNFPATAVGTEF